MQRVFVRYVHSAAQRRALIDRVLRVDHAGELGADRIYAGQMAVLGRSPVSGLIEKMWEDEKEHLDTMEKLCAKHDVRPSLLLPAFSIAAYALGGYKKMRGRAGVGSALLGKNGAMACTVAVEELIGSHYNNQLKDNTNEHKELLATIKRLRDDELHHHDIGLQNNAEQAPFFDALKWGIQTGCRAAIFLAQKI